MGQTSITSKTPLFRRHTGSSNIFVGGLVTLLVLSLTCMVGLGACKTVKTTLSRNKSFGKKVPASQNTGGSQNKDDAEKKDEAGPPTIVTLKSTPLVDSDFVLAKTMPGMVLSTNAPAFASLTTGNLLIPMCPSSNATCSSPSIYIFNPESNTITHIITPSSPFLPYASSSDGIVLGIVPDTTKNFARLDSDLVSILAGAASADSAVPNPDPNAAPVLVTSAVVAGAVSGSSGRPIACKYSEPLCYIPEGSGCGSTAPALRSFAPPSTYDTYCKPYPASKKILGFTSENELVFSSPAATENVISFEPLPALVGSAPSTAVDITVNTMKILGVAGSSDPFSFIDDSLQNLFSFSSVGENKSWTVIQMRDRTIVGNVPLEFSMAGRGTYFSAYNGTILEVRPSSGTNPPAVYALAAEKIYSIVKENLWDDTINE